MSMPPGLFDASKTVTSYPAFASWYAQDIPEGPDPTTATLAFAFLSGFSKARLFSIP